MAERLAFLKKIGGKTKHTKTLTTSSSAAVDMGEDHEYRYTKFSPGNATITGSLYTNHGNYCDFRIPLNVLKYWKYIQVNISQQINTYGSYTTGIGSGRKVATSGISNYVSIYPNVTNWNAQYVVKANFTVYLTQS